MISIYKKEIGAYFSSLIAYIAMATFFVVMGLNLWVFEGNIFDFGYASLELYFNFAPWLLIFLIPAITMRSISEEYSLGTLELLSTKPLSALDIALGKYFSALTIWFTLWLVTLIYFITVIKLGMLNNGIDSGATWGSYIGLFLLGASFVAIGIFASSVSKNQIIAFLMGVVLCYLFYNAFVQISGLAVFEGQWDYYIQSLGMLAHYESLSRGVVDTRDVLYFLSIIFGFLFITKWI